MRTSIQIEKKNLKIRHEYVCFRDIEEAPLNAQEMEEPEFNRLVKNLKRDGVLTSTPLLMEQQGKNKLMCISGHHRIRAAIKAGIEGAICIISEELDDSTRIRLQLAHNDIHGKSNKDVLALLQQSLDDIDFTLIDKSNLPTDIEKTEFKSIDVSAATTPDFRYINICLLEESREKLVDLIVNLENSDAINWLITKPEYEAVKDLLTYAFDKGFKTPGQAFGRFLEIVEKHMDEIKREKK